MEPPSSDASMTCSCSRSPPFRSVRELRILFWHPPLYPYHNMDHHPGETVLRPALHHLGWPWLRTPSLWLPLWVPEVFSHSSSPPLRLALEREYPLFASPLLPSSPHLLLLSGRPARRIQSDSDPKWSSACRFSAGCCHGTVQSDLPYPSLLKKTRAPSGRPPLTFSRSSLDSLLAGFLFFLLILDVALLHKQPPHLRDRQVTMVV